MEARAIILAAGSGTRMKSKKPKVAHDLLGKPLIRWVVDAAREAGIADVISVVGHQSEQVMPFIEADTEPVFQKDRLGTANAVAVCRDALQGFDGSVVILSGDCPLITPQTITDLVFVREKTNAAAVALTMKLDDSHGYGRIVRDSSGVFREIVEQKDCTAEQARISECNAGFYCFNAVDLFWALDNVSNENAQGEFYLTDVLGICMNAGRPISALHAKDPAECLGINSRRQLAEATAHMQRRINARHMDAGVTMTDPSTTWIGPDVKIAADVELLPMTFLFGETSIGEDSVIGPNSRLTDTVVGRACTVDETIAKGARIDDEATCGPRAYLRPGAHLMFRAKAGTHVEIKKSTVGVGSKVPHLSYIGDAEIGADVNIGAGTITCNYDGEKKHATTIGDGAFIGSDTMLVAPVAIGEHAVIGAGSTIAKNVSPYALGIERSKQAEVADWARRKKGADRPDDSDGE